MDVLTDFELTILAIALRCRSHSSWRSFFF